MATPSFAIAKRPEAGRKGKPIEVMTNLFSIKGLPRNIFSHYNEFLLEQSASSGNGLLRKRKEDIIYRLQTNIAPNIFTPKAAFDGQANLFSLTDLGFAERKFIVDMGDRDLPAGVTPRKQFTVLLTKVAEISPVNINNLVQGRLSGSASSVTILQVLNLFLQQAAILRFPGLVAKQNSIFIDSARPQRINGLEVWHGHHLSVRPSSSRLLVNVDTTFTLMYARGELIEVLLEFLGFRSDVRKLSEITEGSRDFIRAKRLLKGLNLIQRTNVPGRDKLRKCKALQLNAGAFEFQLSDGRTTTVAEYFRSVKRTPLRYPSAPGLVTHRGEIIPFELLKIAPGQLFRGKATPEVVSKMLSISKQSPSDRLAKVKGSIVDLRLQTSPFVTQTGMEVDTDPMLVEGRVLDAPALVFGGDCEVNPRDGAWNIVGRSLFRPGKVRVMLLVNYEPSISAPQIRDFGSKLGGGMQRIGIDVGRISFHPTPLDGQKDFTGFSKNLFSICLQYDLRPNDSLVIAILPSIAGEIRKMVKQFGDIQRGIPTQCIRKDGFLRANDQYINNVILKINARIGGINFYPTGSYLSGIQQHNLMILGIDVSHPGPGMMKPSIAGVVSSSDEYGSKYISCLSVQEPRTETVVDLKSMANWHMHLYRRRMKGAFAKNLLVFRDGLSEGELDSVVDIELKAIKDAALSLGAPVPRVTFVVVGKRHHVRFMPKHESEGDRRSGNCPAGLVVDRDIVSPAVFDFYLQSHSGLLGTSKSSHYICMVDEIKLGSDELQEVSYALCHTYARATRAVSIPAPVYYADLVCRRGDIHFDPSANLTMDESASDDSSAFNLDIWKTKFRTKVNDIHLENNLMYYM